MKRKIPLTALFLAIAVLAGCEGHFSLTKNSRTVYLGGGSAQYHSGEREKLYQMLCMTGDLKKALAASSVPEGKKKGLYEYNCEHPDFDRGETVFLSLTPAEKKSLSEAFESEGYDINYFPNDK